MVVWRKIQNEGAVSWWCREHKIFAETLFVMAEQGGEIVSGILVYWRKKVGHERIGNKRQRKVFAPTLLRSIWFNVRVLVR